ncbi:MAG: hypothetical protein AAF442_00405 [Pseudomonadota bacterium]
MRTFAILYIPLAIFAAGLWIVMGTPTTGLELSGLAASYALGLGLIQLPGWLVLYQSDRHPHDQTAAPQVLASTVANPPAGKPLSPYMLAYLLAIFVPLCLFLQLHHWLTTLSNLSGEDLKRSYGLFLGLGLVAIGGWIGQRDLLFHRLIRSLIAATSWLYIAFVIVLFWVLIYRTALVGDEMIFPTVTLALYILAGTLAQLPGWFALVWYNLTRPHGRGERAHQQAKRPSLVGVFLIVNAFGALSHTWLLNFLYTGSILEVPSPPEVNALSLLFVLIAMIGGVVWYQQSP